MERRNTTIYAVIQKGGSPTFELILANTSWHLLSREDLEVKVSIRCNVNQQNRDGVFPLLERLALEGLQTKVTFYAAPIYDWGDSAGMRSSPVEEYAAWEANLMVEMVRLGFKPGPYCPVLGRSRAWFSSPRRSWSIRPAICSIAPGGQLGAGLQPVGVSQGNPLRVINNNYRHEPTNVYQIGDLNGARVPRRAHVSLVDSSTTFAPESTFATHVPCFRFAVGAVPSFGSRARFPFPSAKFNIEQRMLLAYALTRLEEFPRLRQKTQRCD